MLHSKYAEDADQANTKALLSDFPQFDASFDPKRKDISKEEQMHPIFSLYKQHFNLIDRFDIYVSQVSVPIRFENIHAKFIVLTLVIAGVNSWVLYKENNTSDRGLLPETNYTLSIKEFFEELGMTMMLNPENFNYKKYNKTK